jgi:hypothetical protein
MLSDSDLQKLKRYVDLAPYMSTEQRQALLECIRKLKAIEATEQGSWLPGSAVSDLAKCVDDKLMRDIVNDQRHGVGTPGWFPPGNPRPVERGSGWQDPSKVEDRSRQFEVFDAMVAHMVGGPNEPVK